jgi:hypothetical protein
MMMSANVWTPSMKPTMSTSRCESVNAMAKECGSTHVKQKMLHFHNKHKNIPLNIMGTHPLLTMGAMKKVNPHEVQRLPTNAM